MNVYLKNNPSHLLDLDIYWEDELLYTVNKKMFFKELQRLTNCPSRQEFIQTFSLLEVKLAKQAVVNLLARKGYLSQELEKKLSAKGFSPQAIDQAISSAKRGGYVDDAQELARFMRSEARKGRGPQMTLFKLKQKQVPEEALQQIKSDMFGSEHQVLQEWVKKKRIDSNFKDHKERHRCYAQLMRRGFSLEAIRAVFNCDDMD